MTNPLNTSYSSHELLHKCPRKFEIEKLLLAGDKEENIDFVTGKAVGNGIQAILQGHNIETAIWAAYKEWLSIGLEIENKKKSFWRVVKHLEKFQQQTLPEKFYAQGWELVYFTSEDGTKIPACELSFRLILSPDYIYRGYIDAVLYNSSQDLFAVLEAKTSGISPNVAMFQNSFQGSSYSLVLDKITGRESYDVMFPIFEFPNLEQTVFSFTKNKNTKLRWLTSVALDFKLIDMYKEAGSFPMRGGSCYDFFRPCKYLGLCELKNSSFNNEAVVPGMYPEQLVDDKEYHFTFTLAELLAEKKDLEKELVT